LGEKMLGDLRKQSNVVLERGRWRWETGGKWSLALRAVETDMDLGGGRAVGNDGDGDVGAPVVRWMGIGQWVWRRWKRL
jgi:hypothetical protein